MNRFIPTPILLSGLDASRTPGLQEAGVSVPSCGPYRPAADHRHAAETPVEPFDERRIRRAKDRAEVAYSVLGVLLASCVAVAAGVVAWASSTGLVAP